MFTAVCGNGFEAARAHGKGAAGGDAAFYSATEGVESLLFFWGGRRVGREADDLSGVNIWFRADSRLIFSHVFAPCQLLFCLYSCQFWCSFSGSSGYEHLYFREGSRQCEDETLKMIFVILR